MGQRPKPPTNAQRDQARERYEADVAAGRRIPLPDLGQLRDPDGVWQPVAGDGFEIVSRPRTVERRKAKGITFSVFDMQRRRQ